MGKRSTSGYLRNLCTNAPSFLQHQYTYIGRPIVPPNFGLGHPGDGAALHDYRWSGSAEHHPMHLPVGELFLIDCYGLWAVGRNIRWVQTCVEPPGGVIWLGGRRSICGISDDLSGNLPGGHCTFYYMLYATGLTSWDVPYR